MRTIVVVIEYAAVSPAVLESCTFANLMGWCSWHEVDDETFEFSVYCRQEDAAWVEGRLAQYV